MGMLGPHLPGPGSILPFLTPATRLPLTSNPLLEKLLGLTSFPITRTSAHTHTMRQGRCFGPSLQMRTLLEGDQGSDRPPTTGRRQDQQVSPGPSGHMACCGDTGQGSGSRGPGGGGACRALSLKLASSAQSGPAEASHRGCLSTWGNMASPSTRLPLGHPPPSLSVSTRECALPQATCSTRVS